MTRLCEFPVAWAASVGPKPAAASGGSRQAERRESQGAAVRRDYASSPGRNEARAERPGADPADKLMRMFLYNPFLCDSM